jgi:Spy/CpxP family protein refolding chaperone
MVSVLVVGVSAAAAQDGPRLGPGQGQDQRPNQRGGRQGNLPAPAAGMPVQQLQAMFDAFALVQAQRVLQLSDEQYQQFFPRMNRLQDLRRQHAQQRGRLVNELRRMWGPQGADDQALAATISRLDDLETKFRDETRAARTAIDEVLTMRQRAAFRFFEEDMERQKLDFLTRARQGGGGVRPD